MKIRFAGDCNNFLTGIRILAEELGVSLCEDGIEIEVFQADGTLEASCRNGKGRISYDGRVQFFRAFGLWVMNYRKQPEFHCVETPNFTTIGAMIDASRNAVLTVKSIKTMLRKMALMGLNMMLLYTEDTFEMEEYPYFGYMRGRYTYEELADCDDYAYQLGIDMVPCIQTLAHLTEALKWNYATELRDTPDILLVGSEKTYEFIRQMIQTASSPFRSKRIHIGMDEAHQLGLGRYLEVNGYQTRFDIMNNHLKAVVAITNTLGLHPMIWSDMYFRLGSKTGYYYDVDTVIPDDVIQGIPQDVQLVYWDYYHGDKDFYQLFIEKHKGLGTMPIFAGGVQTWNRMAPNYGKTFATTNAALSACKSEGVREVFATLWGDNGAETNVFSSLAGLQLFAEHGYAENVEDSYLAERFAVCTGAHIDDFFALNGFDETPGVEKGNMAESNPSKFLLWQDVLIGLYDDNIKELPMNLHYKTVFLTMRKAAQRNESSRLMFQFYEQLAMVLSIKSELGLRLKDAYDAGDSDKLAELEDQMETMRSEIEVLRQRHRALWFQHYKPFGWEVVDIRYGGLLARVETARHRIHDYLNGIIPCIEELDAPRLYFDAPWEMPQGTLGHGTYHRIVTTGSLSG